MQKSGKFETQDEYIHAFPENVQRILQNLRKLIAETVPEAQEAISYQMPTFKLNGRNLVHFAAFQHHIGLYPFPSSIEAFRQELSGYETSKGAIRFPLNKPIPYDLVKRIVKYRMQVNLELDQQLKKDQLRGKKSLGRNK